MYDITVFRLGRKVFISAVVFDEIDWTPDSDTAQYGESNEW